MKVGGEVTVPGDKSISHRALILSALADGRSRIRGVLASEDVRSTAGALRALGADVPPLGAEIQLRGRGRRGLSRPATDLDCGNSGTTARLLAGVVAGHPFVGRFVGDRSLRRRPMARVARPLEAMGARVELDGGACLPMTVHGAELRPLDWRSDTASAQVKSAILLAGLVAGVRVTVREPAPSRDHTERVLAALGAPVAGHDGMVVLDPVAALAPLDATVPGDASSAAFIAALAALAEAGSLDLPGVCVNPTRTGFVALLREMGASVDLLDEQVVGGEPVARLRVSPGGLRAVAVSADDVPAMIDELPMLACVAARAEGETVIRGAAELRVKESDRIAAVVANLRALGAHAEELPDGMRVVGARRPLRGRVRTAGDHRVAMAFGVLAALPESQIEIDDRECVAVSYPTFWEDLARAIR